MKYNTSFKKPTLISAGLLAAVCVSGPTVFAGDNAGSLADAFAQGDASVDFRYRYEFVDQDNALKDANASTLKTRLNFTTKSWNDLSFKFEMDNVSTIFGDDYNDASGMGHTAYSVVADPIGTDLNQAWVQYSGINKTIVRVGKQRIVLDNQRFVGGVAWRQNEQTYDSLVIANSSIENFKTSFAYIWNVNRIFGPDSEKSDIETDAFLLNFAYSGLSFGKLSAYAYLLDAPEIDAISTQTLGVRLAGKKLGSGKNWSYELEYADQSDYADRPTNLDADYFHAGAAYTANGMTFGLGYEVLSGGTDQVFTSPLATLHKFNGWADQFLGTPADGLEDLYVKFATKLGSYSFTVVAHDFTAEASSRDLGTEIDLVFARKFGKNYKVVLKYAAYNADQWKVDTNKLWLMLSASY